MYNQIMKKAAVFIDYENINLTDSYNLLFKKLIKEGYNPIIRKIICSTIPKKSDFTDVIKNNLLDFIVSYKPLKKGTSKIIKEKNLNNADFRVYIEVLKTLYTQNDIDTFVIATSDEDYFELIQAIKNEGKFLIGMGNKITTSSNYQELFNIFYFVEDLLNESKKIEKEIQEKEVVKQEIKKESANKSVKKEIKKVSKKADKRKTVSKKQETKETKEPKEILRKDQVFYSVLKDAISEELHAALNKNEKTYFVSNLISNIKSESPYLKNYRKISTDDILKCGFTIEYENDEKVKGYIKTK